MQVDSYVFLHFKYKTRSKMFTLICRNIKEENPRTKEIDFKQIKEIGMEMRFLDLFLFKNFEFSR